MVVALAESPLESFMEVTYLGQDEGSRAACDCIGDAPCPLCWAQWDLPTNEIKTRYCFKQPSLANSKLDLLNASLYKYSNIVVRLKPLFSSACLALSQPRSSSCFRDVFTKMVPLQRTPPRTPHSLPPCAPRGCTPRLE